MLYYIFVSFFFATYIGIFRIFLLLLSKYNFICTCEKKRTLITKCYIRRISIKYDESGGGIVVLFSLDFWSLISISCASLLLAFEALKLQNSQLFFC